MSDDKPTRAAIYARTATSNAAGMEQQLAACRQYADSRGYRILFEGHDSAVSGGRQVRRPAQLDLVIHATEREFDTLIVSSHDRLTRDADELERIIAGLADYGVKIETVS